MSLLVVDHSAHVRQAGTLGEGPQTFVKQAKLLAERSLYAFSMIYMGGNILKPRPHGLFCNFLQDIPGRRKLLLAPRNHLKTTISKSLVLHLLIQPDGYNCYFPTTMGSLSHTDGRSTRILLASKGADLSAQKLGSIKTWCESSQLLKATWPHVFWQNPEKQAPKWNQESLQFQRAEIFDQATVEIVGVGGVITGQHFNCHIHDDLVDEKDRFSPTTMERAYNWFHASRALFDGVETGVELVLGTHWANNDIYVRMIEHELDMDVMRFSALIDTRTGQPFSQVDDKTKLTDLPQYIQALWPEGPSTSLSGLQKIRTDLIAAGKGDLFALNYLNDPLHSSIVDFDISQLRYFTKTDNTITFDSDPRDDTLRESYLNDASPRTNLYKQKLTPETLRTNPWLYDSYFTRG